jgi:uncharacterized membrane protein (Fun14 family)
MSDELGAGPRRKRSPVWAVGLLILAIVVAAAGGVMWSLGEFNPPAAPQGDGRVTTLQRNGAPNAGLVDSGSSSASPAGPSLTEQAELKYHDWKARYGPTLVALGISFAGGFVVGTMFRTFIRTAAVLAAVFVVAVIALSFFGVIHLDFTAAQQRYAGAIDWLQGEGLKLWQLALKSIPSTAAGIVGVIVGFVRR